MVTSVRPLYYTLLTPAKWVEASYWDRVEDNRGTTIGSPSGRRGELSNRILSVAHAIFQGIYAVFTTLPVLGSALFSMFKCHDSNPSFAYIHETAFRALESVWSPMICSVMVAINPSLLDSSDRAVRTSSNRIFSDLLFRTTPH